MSRRLLKVFWETSKLSQGPFESPISKAIVSLNQSRSFFRKYDFFRKEPEWFAPTDLKAVQVTKEEVPNNYNAALLDATMVSEVEADPNSPYLKHGTPVPSLYDYTRSVAQFQQTQVTTLPNGFRVATQFMPHKEVATVGVMSLIGSRFEDDESNGIAHFLEHMFFKGTKKRSAKQLEVEVENSGTQLNAFTAREYTFYFANAMKDKVADSVDILADMLLNVNITQDQIDREKQTILREFEEVNTQKEEVLMDHLHATAFQHSPLAKTILGNFDVIQNMTVQQLNEYRDFHYTGGRMVLVAAGNVDHNQLVKQAEKLFGGIKKTGDELEKMIKFFPSYYVGSEIRFREPDLENLNIIAAFRGPSQSSGDLMAVQVMQQIIGDWNHMSPATWNQASKLSQSIARHYAPDSSFNSLDMRCKHYSAFTTNYIDTGIFGFMGTLDPMGAPDVFLMNCINEYVKMTEVVLEFDVTWARNKLKAMNLFINDSTHGVADEIGRQLLFLGRRMNMAETFARIDAVDPKAVRTVADKYIYDQDPVMVLLGDTFAVPDYNDVVVRLSNKRF